MNFEKKLAISLSEIKDHLSNGDINTAEKSLDRLWRVVARLGQNNEIIHCGTTIHSEEVIESAMTENRIILGSDLDLHEILLRKEFLLNC